MNMTDEQWGRLLVALGCVPAADVAMACNMRDVRDLFEVVMRGIEWEHTRSLRLSDEHKDDALFFARTFGIDPATGQYITSDDGVAQ